jgi:hypothetical protein
MDLVTGQGAGVLLQKVLAASLMPGPMARARLAPTARGIGQGWLDETTVCEAQDDAFSPKLQGHAPPS